MSFTSGVKGANKILAIADTLDVGVINDGEILTRTGTDITSVPLTSTTNTSFRETHAGLTLNAGAPNPSYVNKWVTFNTPFDYVNDVDGHFTFDNEFVQINIDGVYRYDITISTTGNASGRSEQFFLTNDTLPIDETNVQYVIASATTSQLEYAPTWQGDSCVQSACMSGTCNIVGSPIKLRVAYIVQADVQINRELTTWSMQYIPPDVNTGPQGPQGIPGTPGAVNSITVTAPITLGGTLADPIIGHQLGAGGVFSYPYNLNTNASGHVTSCQTGTGNGWFSIAAGTNPITVTSTGIVPNRLFTVSHAVSGSGAGTVAFPSSITYNVSGHITAITGGTAPAAAIRTMATRDLFAGTLTIPQGNLSPLFGILGIDANGTTGAGFGIWSTSVLGNLFQFTEAGMYSITYHIQTSLNFNAGIGAEAITSIRSEVGSRGAGVDLDTVNLRAPNPGAAGGTVKSRMQSTLTTTFAVNDQISFSYLCVQTPTTNDIIASDSNSSISIVKLT